MNSVSGHWIFLLVAAPALADSLPLEGPAYHPAELTIEWKASTEQLPKSFWVYKVIPQNFSAGVISNAMAIGNFQPRNLAKPADKNLIQFRDAGPHPSHYLKIALGAGWMEYYDGQAKMPIGEPIEGVPDEHKVEVLARDYLHQFGIDRSQVLAKRGYAGDERKGTLSAAGADTDVEVVAREISLIRQIDGIPFYGKGNLGGFWIQFGNHGKVSGFDLVWPNLLPHELRTTASVDQIVASVKNGKASLRTGRAVEHDKKLTITAITPYYLGAHWSAPQEFVHPIASLSVIADLGNRTEAFELVCPI